MQHPNLTDLLTGSAVQLAHALIADVIREGDVAVDATCGNGHDTAFMANLIGVEGHLYAFDVQEAAIRSTAARLEAGDFARRVTLLRASHADLNVHIPSEHRGRIRAVMFNLGYLPGHDGSIRTHEIQTVPALMQSADALISGGVMTVVVYTGHEGGAEEAAAIEKALGELDPGRFIVTTVRPKNRSGSPPYLVVVKRMR